ncbi:MAG: sigma 54-interacting transcriptional regulator [Planctomycetota bacterium]|nr:sigma 54-interacting transcriptional regulator [Planctomycetota bacterium]
MKRRDVRVVAATHRDLKEEAREGRFREDLYYRLNVFPIRVPPLRERVEDIPLLAGAFLERFAQRNGRSLAPLTEADAARLKAYAWPGNVRELENVIERAVIIARDGRLDLDRALPELPPAAAAFAPPAPAGDSGIRTVSELQQLERRNLVRALEACEWKVAGDDGAAKLLGMKPSTLSSRIKALGIEKPR